MRDNNLSFLIRQRNLALNTTNRNHLLLRRGRTIIRARGLILNSSSSAKKTDKMENYNNDLFKEEEEKRAGTNTNTNNKKVLLTFDVDGTLIRSTGQDANRFHKNAFKFGFKKVFNIETSIDCVEHHGSTDKLIIKAVLNYHKVDEERILEGLENVCQAMVEYAEENAEDAANGIELLPGVYELLERLSKREDCCCALVTGNLEPIAWAKMKQLGIDKLFQREVRGGFGSDHEQRSALVSIAHERAKSIIDFHADRRYHFGDTHNDITAAEQSGAIAIGLATGIWSLDDLKSVSVKKDEALFLESLADVDDVLTKLRLI